MIGAELATCACGRPGNHRGMCAARWSRVRGDQPLRTRRPTGVTRSNMAKRRFKQDRWRERSRFFPGIAAAMATQWGGHAFAQARAA